MNSFFTPRTKPFIIAHRGASGDAPENTIAAFREAIKQRADAIELDIQLTRDKQLVVMHDHKLERTTRGKGRVARKHLHEIQRHSAGSWFGPGFADERAPSLDQVLQIFGRTTSYVVELKFYEPRVRYFSNAVVQTIQKHNLLDRCLFLSFSPFILRAIKQIEPSAKTCLAFRPIGDHIPPRATLRHADSIALASHFTDLAYIRKLRSLNLPINIWAKTQRNEDYDHEIAVGADFITTNHPKLLRDHLRAAK